jgi:hypothetical protein
MANYVMMLFLPFLAFLLLDFATKMRAINSLSRYLRAKTVSRLPASSV